ncbi:hypothetical protein J3R83DRAFT_5392 [Lanmaoa asiatica]|nr:hypothetical protein J3R83DRAFT_5392 [Lanmaoa asiatica]
MSEHILSTYSLGVVHNLLVRVALLFTLNVQCTTSQWRFSEGHLQHKCDTCEIWPSNWWPGHTMQ